MGKSFTMLFAVASLSVASTAVPALSGTPISILTDRSELFQLSSDPATVVVGNPSIADVSVNGRQLFIHGHSAGETNLLVFDQGGQKIADFEVSISQAGSNSLVVFKGNTTDPLGAARYSYVCAPVCERAMMAGDTNQPVVDLVSVNQKKLDFAQGAKSTDKPAAATGAAPAQ